MDNPGVADTLPRDVPGLDATPDDVPGRDQPAVLTDATSGDGQDLESGPADAPTTDHLLADLVRTDAQDLDGVALDASELDSSTEDSHALPVPVLDGFDAATGQAPGSIVLDLNFPDDTSGFLLVQIRRASGPQAPDCSSGDIVVTLSPGAFNDLNVPEDGLTELETYSYRACVYDSAGVLVSTRTASAVAMGCWWDGTPVSYSGLPADIIDAWAGQWPIPNVDPPRQILSGIPFVAGSRIVLSGFRGQSICRIYSNQVQCSAACPIGWKLFFKDATGNLLWSAGMIEDLSDFVDGVRIPDGAATAWIGYREAGCTTGTNCSGMGDPYMDNCDNRTVNGDCDRCDFEFRHEVLACNAP